MMNDRDFDPSLLDPGIRDVVIYLREAGWVTTDSGDGVTKLSDPLMAGEVIPFPHVVISPDHDQTRSLADQCDEVFELLKAKIGDSDGQHDWDVEGTYLAASGVSTIMVSGVNDDRLAGRGKPRPLFDPSDY